MLGDDSCAISRAATGPIGDVSTHGGINHETRTTRDRDARFAETYRGGSPRDSPARESSSHTGGANDRWVATPTNVPSGPSPRHAWISRAWSRRTKSSRWRPREGFRSGTRMIEHAKPDHGAVVVQAQW